MIHIHKKKKWFIWLVYTVNCCVYIIKENIQHSLQINSKGICFRKDNISCLHKFLKRLPSSFTCHCLDFFCPKKPEATTLKIISVKETFEESYTISHLFIFSVLWLYEHQVHLVQAFCVLLL